MSGRLVGEVVEWLRTPAARGISQAERVVLLVVAERANEQDRVMWRHRADTESLHERIRGALDVDAKSLGNVLGRLARRGLEVRVPTGRDKRGRPTFANNGHSTRFRLPEFPASVALPPAQSSIEEWTFPVDNPPDQPVDNSSEPEGKVHPLMDLHEEGPSTDGASGGKGPSTDGPYIPLKTVPLKEDPSTPVVPVSQPDVEDRPAVHREPSAGSQYRQPPLMAAVPDLPGSADYDRARDTLAALPDLGSALLETARAALPGAPLAQLVIHAATLARRTA